MSDLEQFLKDNAPTGPFKPYAHWDGNTLTVYFGDEPDYTEQVSRNIDLFRTMDGNGVVGCRIFGVPMDELRTAVRELADALLNERTDHSTESFVEWAYRLNDKAREVLRLLGERT